MDLYKIILLVSAATLVASKTVTVTNVMSLDKTGNVHDSASARRAFRRRNNESNVDCSMVFYNDVTSSDYASVERSLSTASAEMLLFLECLNHESHFPITWTIASDHYKEAFRHWREMVLRYDSRVYFAVALDEDAYHSLRAARIPTILYRYNRTTSDAVGSAKFSISYGLHAHNRNFLFSELDVFWSKNPLPFIPVDVDLAISAHSYSEESNLGFWFSRATEKTRLLYRKATFATRIVLEYSKIDARKWLWRS